MALCARVTLTVGPIDNHTRSVKFLKKKKAFDLRSICALTAFALRHSVRILKRTKISKKINYKNESKQNAWKSEDSEKD